MTRYVIECEQSFMVTYIVDADSPEDAWNELILGSDARCEYQQPGEILGTILDADITEDIA